MSLNPYAILNWCQRRLLLLIISVVMLFSVHNTEAQYHVWAWGGSSSPEFDHPVPVNGLTNVVSIACGSVNLALKADGTVWAWGYNYHGEKGDGTWGFNSSPGIVKTSLLTDIISIGAGFYHSLAARSDGTIWAWGDNSRAQLGIGPRDTSAHATPSLVIDLTNVIRVAAGYWHSLALKSDGTVWAWGLNLQGQLGNGIPSDYSDVPVQVKGLNDVIAVAGGGFHSLALKSDGTVWAWGANGEGQLGDGGRNMFSSNKPVQVVSPTGGFLTDVVAIAAGQLHSLALKSDGTVWAWGDSSYGELGNGTFHGSIKPVQVSNLSNVVAIAGGDLFSLAVRADGTAWAWGRNLEAQLGIGTSGYSLGTPVQIENLTGVITLAGGHLHSLALTQAAISVRPRLGHRLPTPKPHAQTNRK